MGSLWMLHRGGLCVVLMGQVWYLTPTWGCWGASALLLYVCTVLGLQSSEALAGAWGRLAMGAWCVCIEESHADE